MAEEEKPKPYFDEEKQKKAIEWITQKCGTLKCECCGVSQWQLTPEVVASPIFQGGMMLGGSVSPTFTVVCMNCGNTKFFNALISKVISPVEKKEGEDGK